MRAVVFPACRRSAGRSLRQLRVCDDVDVDEDSYCYSMMEVSAGVTSNALHHAATAAVTMSQTDTGYQSNIMQTTGMHDGALSTNTTSTAANVPYIQQQHSAAETVDVFH